MKKTKNKKFLIIVLIVLLLGLAVGYAAFSDTLNITGTANAGGNFDMVFSTATISTSEGIDTDNSSAVISGDKNTLTVTIKDLSYPGAGAQIDTVIHNAGTIPAKVKSVNTTLPSGQAIKVNGLNAITTAHPVIAAGGDCNLSFTVVWDENVNELSDEEKSGVTFDLTIEYEQATTSFEGTASHND